MSRRYFSNLGRHPVAMGVVDDCLIVRFPGIDSKPYPDGDIFDYALDLFHSIAGDYERSFIDLANVKRITHDVEEFVNCMPGSPVINVRRSGEAESWATSRGYTTICSKRLGAAMTQFPMNIVQLVIGASSQASPYTHDLILEGRNRRQISREFSTVLDELENVEYDLEWETASEGIAGWIRERLQRSAIESPLHQIAILAIDGRLKPRLYHTGASYKLHSETGEVFLSRPGVLASRTNLILGLELRRFEELINDSEVRESDLQGFLEDHPNFLLGSDYQKLYPQVGLTREDEPDLIPDFLLQPAWSTPWCDILDLKLPSASVIAGSRNRRRFSAAVADGIAQLREYSAFFEEASQRTKVYRTLGVSCYRPQMILVIGRHLPELNSLQMSRELSRYPGLRIMTYDALLENAKRRLLL